MYAGAVTVENLTVRATDAVGGAGGAGSGGGSGGAGLGGGLFVASAGTVTLDSVTFQNDSATGGAGGFGRSGVGGGGLGGAGGAGAGNDGGGGEFAALYVVRRCMAEGLVGGEGFAVDASMVKADANRQRGVSGSDAVVPEAANHAVKLQGFQYDLVVVGRQRALLERQFRVGAKFVSVTFAPRT